MFGTTTIAQALTFDLWSGTEATTTYASGSILYETAPVPCNVRGSCDFCDALVVGQNAVNIMFEIAVPLAVIFIIYGAIMLMVAGGVPKRFENALTTIKTAVIGLAIVLAAWIGVNTIINLIASSNFKTTSGDTLDLRFWNKVECR